MRSNEIAAKLATARTEAECVDLINKIPHRRDEIRARERAIQQMPQGSLIPTPPERAAATSKGIDASKKLDDELEDLAREFNHLGALETQAYHRAESLKVQKTRDQYPGALRELNAKAKRVQAALDALDAAIADHRTSMHLVADALALPDINFPFDDAELAEQFTLRDRVWAVRNLATVFPPCDELDPDVRFKKYPKTWPLVFDTRGSEGSGESVHRRCAPQQFWLPDYISS